MAKAQRQSAQQILFNVAANYDPTALGDIEHGTATDVAFDLTSVADAAAEQSDKADLDEPWALEYAVQASLEFASAPTTGTTCDFYWAPSVSSSAATGNPGYVIGASGVYAGGVATLAEGLAQLIFIGSMVCSADATTTVQTAHVGTLSPPTRYGTLVMVNNSGQATHNDVVEQAVSFTPIVTRS